MVSNLPFAFEWFDHRFLHRFTRFPSAPFQVRHTPYPASYPKAIGGGADRWLPRFPAAFRPPAFASGTVLRPLGNGAVLAEGLPRTNFGLRTPSGLSRCAWVRCDRVGRPLDPGTAVFTRPMGTLRSAPAASQRPVLDPATTFHLPGLNWRGIIEGSRNSSFRSSPSPVVPGWNGNPPA